jgi:hypothetical protein
MFCSFYGGFFYHRARSAALQRSETVVIAFSCGHLFVAVLVPRENNPDSGCDLDKRRLAIAHRVRDLTTAPKVARCDHSNRRWHNHSPKPTQRSKAASGKIALFA